ncbi:MAG: ABC transporter substrate-binding protein [Anaerococcus sp.]|nr:ABC transporter substrate-binding protein [Anaerococcus sp.]
MKIKSKLAILLASSCIFAGCESQVNSNTDANNTSSEIEENSNESAKANTDTKELEDVQQVAAENAKKDISEEPRYNDTIKLGYSGDLCLGAPNIANLNAYFKDRDINVEFVNTKQPKDALRSGKLEGLVGEFARMIVPATKGADIVFSSASHTGCKSLYVLSDSSIQKTKELEGKNIAITNGIGNSNHNTALIQAMQSGEIDSAVLDDQYAKQFVDKGIIRPIRSMTHDDDFGSEVCCVLAFT